MKLITFTCLVSVIGLCVLQNTSVDLTKGPSTAPVTGETTASLPAEEERIFAAGIVEGADRTKTLNFEVMGRLTEIVVNEGAQVRAGEILARLDQGMARERLVEAQAQLDLAKAEYARLAAGTREETLRVARAEADLVATSLEHSANVLSRAQKLAKDNAISRDDFDARGFLQKQSAAQVEVARSRVRELEAPPRPEDLKVAQVKIQIAEAAVAQANVAIENLVLHAPADGTILSVNGEIGELMGPDRPRPFVTMADLGTLHVRAFVEELDALSIDIGDHAEAAIDGRPNKTYAGCVVWIAPEMTDKLLRHGAPGERHDVKVREVLIRLEDAKELVVGLPVEVFLSRKADAIEEDAAISETAAPDLRTANKPIHDLEPIHQLAPHPEEAFGGTDDWIQTNSETGAPGIAR